MLIDQAKFKITNWNTALRGPCPADSLSHVLLKLSTEECQVIPLIKFRIKDKAWFRIECELAHRNKQDAFRLLHINIVHGSAGIIISACVVMHRESTILLNLNIMVIGEVFLLVLLSHIHGGLL